MEKPCISLHLIIAMINKVFKELFFRKIDNGISFKKEKQVLRWKAEEMNGYDNLKLKI